MQYSVNPRNGDRISALGLGCMSELHYSLP